MELNRKIRLPELPIFRKFSLALRQEFARPEEILQALEESRRQIKAMSEGGAGRLHSALRTRRPAELVGPPRDPDAEDILEGEDSPASFLKIPGPGSMGSRGPLRTGPRDDPGATRATQPLEDHEGDDLKDAAPEDLEDVPGKKTAASGGSASRTAPEESGKGRGGPRRKPSKAEAGDSPAKKAAPKSAGKGADSKNASGKSLDPAQNKSSGPAGGENEEREFWGEDRSWGKGRKGKAGSQKGSPGRVGIVRIGAEGRPVEEKDGLADEGDE